MKCEYGQKMTLPLDQVSNDCLKVVLKVVKGHRAKAISVLINDPGSR